MQASVALSTAESTYVGISKCAQFTLWYKQLVSSMGLELAYYQLIVVLSDSQSEINIATSNVSVVNKYTKHVRYKEHWFREFIRDGTLRMLHIAGTNNISDIFTKVLAKPLFVRFRSQLLGGDFRDLRSSREIECAMQAAPAMQAMHVSANGNGNVCNCHVTDSLTCFERFMFMSDTNY